MINKSLPTQVLSLIENPTAKGLKYNVEFFHIYLDQQISLEHKASLDYLKNISKDWEFDFDLMILIDDYNPLRKVITSKEIIDYLDSSGVMPDYYAFEKDLVKNAGELIEHINNKHLRRSYEKYISKSSKYPCSLLTATWYLTRLGRFNAQKSIHSLNSDVKLYKKADLLINILPQSYKAIEERAFNLISNSTFSTDCLKIEDIFIPVDSVRIQGLM